jgi:hypothetical protein
MKLIDADALKQVTEESIAEYGNDYYTGDIICGMRRVVYYATTYAPTIDAVPVIRCKDCKYYRKYADGRYDCDNLYGIDDPHKYCFCSRAERRKDNG